MSQYDIRPDFECQDRILNVKIRYSAQFRMSKNKKRKANNEKRIPNCEKTNNEKRKEKNKKRKTNKEKRKTNQLHLALIEVFMRSVGTINVLKVRTLIHFYFP